MDFLHLAKIFHTSASATSLTVTTVLINYAYSCNISVNYLSLKTENVFILSDTSNKDYLDFFTTNKPKSTYKKTLNLSFFHVRIIIAYFPLEL